MADNGILCSASQVILKAGVNSNATAITAESLNDFILQAEGQIMTDTEYDWVTNIASIDAKIVGVLNLAASNLAAIYVINYDPNAWTLATASFKRDTLWTGYDEAVKRLRDVDKNQIFVRDY